MQAPKKAKIPLKFLFLKQKKRNGSFLSAKKNRFLKKNINNSINKP
jgi:hypothetical protein